MQTCSECRRHVRDHEVRCPFCSTALQSAPAEGFVTRGTRAAIFLSATVTLAACNDPPPPAVQPAADSASAPAPSATPVVADDTAPSATTVVGDASPAPEVTAFSFYGAAPILPPSVTPKPPASVAPMPPSPAAAYGAPPRPPGLKP